MKSIKTYQSFQSYLKGKKDIVTPDLDTSHDDCRKLLELVRAYRHAEDAYFEKVRTKQFAVNEKDRMLKLQKQIDYLMYSITL